MSQAKQTWQPGDIVWIDRYPKMVKEFSISPMGNQILQDRLGLIRSFWETGDTCIECGHTGMAFQAEERGQDDNGNEWWLGTLRCPECGAAEHDVIVDETQIPDGLQIKKA